MGSYDQINKIKAQKDAIIKQLQEEIASLKAQLEKEKAENSDLRKKLHDAGEGNSENSRLKKIITAKERNEKTLQNKIDKLEGKAILSMFSEERKELIQRIRKLEFTNSIFNSLAIKFKDGTENIIKIAYLIKCNSAGDMDYFTYVFRDTIVGLLEKMFYVLTGKKQDSAAKYLVKLSNKEYELSKKCYAAVPKMKDKKTLTNILWLINMQSTAYHGSTIKSQKVLVNKETNEVKKYINFFNLESKDQLDAIFTLLKFMYFVFTCDDWEQNLTLIAGCWFKTL